MSLYIGIDNGLNGGIGVIDQNQNVIYHIVMPVLKGKKTEYDVNRIVMFFNMVISYAKRENENVYAILEKAHVRPISGKRACFMNGFGYGLMQGILGSLEISYEIVQPKIWQKDIFKGMQQQDTKQASIMFCKKKWPKIDWTATEKSKKEHDGKTDAASMALYCYRLNRK